MTEHQPPPLDLDAIEARNRGHLGLTWHDDVPALVAELRAQRATVAALTAERDRLRAGLEWTWEQHWRLHVGGKDHGREIRGGYCELCDTIRDALLGRVREGAGG